MTNNENVEREFEEIPKEGDVEKVSDYTTFLFKESSNFRRPKETKWREYMRFYNGDQWKNNNQKKPVVNWIFTTIEFEMPILTDSRPGTDVISIKEENLDDAFVLKNAIDTVYNNNHLDLRLAQGVRSALISTNSYLYTDWDQDKKNGDGAITIKTLPWHQVYLDPSEGDLDDSSYTLIRRPVKVNAIKRQFPEHADDIEPEEIDDKDIADEFDMFMIENRFHAPSSRLSSTRFKPQDMVYSFENYIRDFTMEPIPEEETKEVIQSHLESILQGAVPDVSRFMDHEVIIEALTLKLQELGGISEQEQADAQEASEVGPQIIQEELENKINTGDIETPEDAQIAEESLMGELEEQVTSESDNDVAIEIMKDIIEQHQLSMQTNKKGQKPKYPGNLRLVVKASDTILYDGPTPVENGMVPLAPIYAYKIEDQPYSDGEVKNILDSQKMFNELNWDEHQNLRLNANSGWVIDDNSGVNVTSLTNEPGIVIKKKQGTEAARLPPGQVSPQLSQKQQSARGWIQDISGINEAAKGDRPPGITAASAITALQEQSIGRIRLKSRMLEDYTMLRQGQITASYIVRYWDKKRMLKNYDDSGRIQNLLFDPDRMFDLQYEVRMIPGTTFGLSKEAVFNQTATLLDKQAIDAETFFEINRNNIPFATKALQKLQERNQLESQAQALAEENDELKLQLEQLLGPQPVEGVSGAQAPPPAQGQVQQVG